MKQIFVCSESAWTTFPLGTTTTYLFSGASNSDPTLLYNLFPDSGTIRNLSVTLGTAPGSGQSRTFSLYVNGTASANQTVTISDTDVSAGPASTGHALSAGDQIVIQSDVSSASVANSTGYIAMEIELATAQRYVMFAQSQTNFTTGTRYISPLNRHVTDSAENDIWMPMPHGAIYDSLYGYLSGTHAAGSGRYLYVRSNSTTLGGTLDLTGANQMGSLTSQNGTVAALDLVSIAVIGTGTPTNPIQVNTSMVMIPDVDGEFALKGAHYSDALNATTTEYAGWNGEATWTATESGIGYDFVLGTTTLKDFTGYQDAAAGAGNTITFTVRKDAADVNGAVVLTGTGAGGSIATDSSGTDVFVGGEIFSVQVVPVSTPTVGFGRFSFTATYDPPAPGTAAIAQIPLRTLLGVGI